MAMPSAPVLGKFSETKPTMVGQKKHTPKAKTAAAPKSIEPEA